MQARLLFLGLLCLAAPAVAIESIDEYARRPPAGEVVQALGDGLFGDTTSYYSGTTTFAVTDVSLPGNSKLPVAVGRTHTVGARGGKFSEDIDGPHGAGAFGEWDIDLPSLHGVFSMQHGWQVVGGAPDARCSAPHSAATMRPPDVGLFDGDEYWGGHTLHVPGVGSQRVLLATTPLSTRPQSSAAYRWNTGKHWYLSCTTLKNGAGEGFIAHAPDGTRYHFDWMVYQRTSTILRLKLHTTIERKIGYLYPTRVEDRFGNWVTYTWSGDSLQSIQANDGRSLRLEYTHVGTGLSAGPKVISVTDGIRTWQYQYASNTSLQQVILPDGSAWQLQTAVPVVETSNGYPGGEFGCMPRMVHSPKESVYRMTHPSGATGEFVFEPTSHGRGRVYPKCGWNPHQDEDANRSAGLYFHAVSLKRKRIAGIGMHDRSWTLTYNGQEGTWFDCAVCYVVKSAEVIDNAGHATRYFFSIHFGVSEGRLLEVQEGTATQSLRKTFHYHDTADLSSSPAYQRVLGHAGDYVGKSPTDETQVPQYGGDVLQEGFTYRWRADMFDALARPQRMARFNANNPGSIEVTQYHDDTNRWVLGQPLRVTTNDVETSKTVFDAATALPLQTYAFGKLRETFTYNADGTVSSIGDGNGHVTKYAQWKRGQAQRVTFPATPEAPNGAVRTSVINNDGTLASSTDERGNTTCYAQDAMGRLSRITHPSETQVGVCDASTWVPTHIHFSPGHGTAYGLPAGHWRQTTQTGNARHVVFLDALWRPVVEQTLDITDPAGTTREVVKRYDAGGRLSFESYPMNTGGSAHHLSTPLHGIGTRYDVLGRVTHVDEATELGVLTTVTEYLPGGALRVTNPRGHSTTSSFQHFEAPNYTAPVEIQHPGDVRTDIERDVFGKPVRITRSGPEG